MVLLLEQEGAKPRQQGGHLGKTSGVAALDISSWIELVSKRTSTEGISNHRRFGERALLPDWYSAERTLLLPSVRIRGI